MQIKIVYEDEIERDNISEHLFELGMVHSHDNKKKKGTITLIPQVYNPTMNSLEELNKFSLDEFKTLIPTKGNTNRGIKDHEIGALVNVLTVGLKRYIKAQFLREAIATIVRKFFKDTNLKYK